MNIRFISDLHLGHLKTAHNRGFKDIEDMFLYMKNKWNKEVEVDDTVYILGDIAYENSKHYHLLDQLNGKKVIIMGNHDRGKDVKELLKYVKSIEGPIKMRLNTKKGNKSFILSHHPIHISELYNNINIHGHTHEKFITKIDWCYFDHVEKEILDDRYINVCCDVLDFTPLRIEELM